MNDDLMEDLTEEYPNRDETKMSIVFNVEKMEKLMWTDQFLLHQFVDTVKKHPYKRALRIVFDTYVLEDSVMEQKYSVA